MACPATAVCVWKYVRAGFSMLCCNSSHRRTWCLHPGASLSSVPQGPLDSHQMIRSPTLATGRAAACLLKHSFGMPPAPPGGTVRHGLLHHLQSRVEDPRQQRG